MILPRRLFLLADGRFCEEDDARQAMNFRAKGFIIPDAEAERIGLIAYLNATGWGDVAVLPEKPEAKAVEQSTTENKAVSAPSAVTAKPEVPASTEEETEESAELGPGLHIDPAQRRGGRRGV